MCSRTAAMQCCNPTSVAGYSGGFESLQPHSVWTPNEGVYTAAQPPESKLNKKIAKREISVRLKILYEEKEFDV